MSSRAKILQEIHGPTNVCEKADKDFDMNCEDLQPAGCTYDPIAGKCFPECAEKFDTEEDCNLLLKSFN